MTVIAVTSWRGVGTSTTGLLLAAAVAASGSEEAATFCGTGTRGNLCICPAPKAHVAEEFKAITAVSKERRKAREERALIKAPKKG